MRVEVREVTKRYGRVRALDDVSMEIEPGRIVAVLGANGAGKSTLLRLLAGVVRGNRGEVYYDGELFLRSRIDLRKRFLFLPDFPFVYPSYTSIDHLGMVLRLFDLDPEPRKERIIDLLEEFDLLPLINSPISKLSRGQAYKTALVGLLAVDPELWMLDEPLASGMDPHGITAFKRHVRAARVRGRTILYSTQILQLAEGFSDKVCVFHEGALRAYDPVDRLRQRAANGERGLEGLFERLREETQ